MHRAFRHVNKPAWPGIPAFELSQISVISISQRRHEIIADDCLAIVALKVEIHTAPEAVLAKQSLDHPNHFGAFVVGSDGVEVVDF